MNTDLFTEFNTYFEMVPAISAKLRRKVYELRYQIYCLETKFENPFNFPNEFEFDMYDRYSVHVLVRHRHSKKYIATYRLILPIVSTATKEKKFPIELYSNIEKKLLLNNISRAHLGEMSRFCISKSFKKRKNQDSSTLTGISNEWMQNITNSEERRTYPLITIALMSYLIKSCHENNVLYCFAIMEPALIRFFKILGVNFKRIGSEVDYHGIRIPCIISLRESYDELFNSNHNIWKLLTNNGEYGSKNLNN